MVDCEIIVATKEHANFIAKNMRDEDKKEIWAHSGSTPESAMRRGFGLSSMCYTGFVGENPAFMVGVSSMSLLSGTGSIWMLSTQDFNKIKFGRKEFRIMREYIRQFLEEYSLIENYVHADNKESIKWLKFLGFTMSEPEKIGLFNQKFIHFEMRA